jgi:phosphoribosyl 1,2-cyclic phosphodiesterase
MILYSIASGSSGNCTYVGSSRTNLLVDAGISAKRIESGLNEIDVKPDTIQGILVTHEHTDHIMGLRVLARRYRIPIYATYGTIREIRSLKAAQDISDELFLPVKPNEPFRINDITIEPFSTSHDAADPVCYTMQADGRKLGIATDLGMYDDYIVSKLDSSDLLMVEANHDVNMLMVGRYPYFLKQRILGIRGHLSNEASAELISRLAGIRLKHVLLAHLSKENNYEELAYETVLCGLSDKGCDFSRMQLYVAHRDVPTQPVII